MDRLAVVVEPVPDRERDAEEALARDEPVAVEPLDPVGEPRLHVAGDPADLVAAGDERGSEVGVAAAVGDVPLPGRDDLERLVAPLVEVRDALGRLRVALEVAGGAERVGRHLAGRERGLAGELGERRTAGVVGDPLRHVGEDAAVAADDGAVGQLQLAPPLDVGEVAERAAHGDAGALVHLGGMVGQHGNLDAEQRRADGGAEQVLVALVVRVGDERHARGDQLRTRGLDVDGAARVVVGHPVVRAGIVAGLELGLGDGGLVRDVPQRGGVLLVRLAAGDVAQEGALGDGLRLRADRRVLLGPVDRQAEGAPQALEDLLVLDDELVAQVDEVAPADRAPVVSGQDRPAE